ncbi:hypothetical protein ES705_26408 [subsurface metagenome]
MSRLSESKHPAYHLRPNKAIDRFIFLDLLRALEIWHPLREHAYVGLGGPFLEDFRLFSQQFPLRQLMCIEKDEETFKRQKFHLCSSNMQCFYRSLGDFIATRFPSDRPVIVWADYNDMNRECLCEVADIVRKSVPNSLLRVTVRAESPVPRRIRFSRYRYPPCVPGSQEDEFENIRDEHLSDMAVDGIVFRSEWFQWLNFSVDNYPRLLARMVRTVAQGSCTHPKIFQPLHAVKYSDGTIMLSITGMICNVNERDSLEQHFRNHFAYYSSNNDEIDEIDVPNLTTKERLHLESILPTAKANGEACVKSLGYLVEGDGSEKSSKKKMEQFEKYYRLYPYFGKIVP